MHANCTRPYSHSLSDDEKSYKTDAERAAEALRDPVRKFEAWLIENNIVDRVQLDQVMQEVDAEIQEVSERAMKAPVPSHGTALRYLYSERVDPTSAQFEAEPHFSGDPRTMVDTITLTMHEELGRNPNIVVFGEDIADCSRDEHLNQVKGKGGVFKATQGLQTDYGSGRVFNTPIAEAAIVGRASAWPCAG